MSTLLFNLQLITTCTLHHALHMKGHSINTHCSIVKDYSQFRSQSTCYSVVTESTIKGYFRWGSTVQEHKDQFKAFWGIYWTLELDPPLNLTFQKVLQNMSFLLSFVFWLRSLVFLFKMMTCRRYLIWIASSWLWTLIYMPYVQFTTLGQ